MPLYEYECFLCGHRFERIQRVSDETVSDCPECGGSVRRLLSAPALQFKGSGWYVTDYADRSKKSSPDPEKKSSDSSSKPEKKAASGKTGKAKSPSKKAAD